MLTLEALDKANYEKLKSFARDEMGINPRNMKEDTLREKIRAYLSGEENIKPAGIPEITPDGEPNRILDIDKLKGEARFKAAMQDKVFITLHNDQNDKRPLFVGVQGRAFLIPREIKVAVPRPVIEVLRNAVGTSVDQDSHQPSQYRAHNFEIHEAA